MKTWEELRRNVTEIERIRILLIQHRETFGGEQTSVDTDFKQALRENFTLLYSEINDAKTTLNQMSGSATWSEVREKMYVMIGQQTNTSTKVVGLNMALLEGDSSRFNPVGSNSARSNQNSNQGTPRLVCRMFEQGGQCRFGDTCKYIHAQVKSAKDPLSAQAKTTPRSILRSGGSSGTSSRL